MNQTIRPVPFNVAENVAIYGWSHGGGATALLANALELGKGQGIVPDTFEIAATAYIDAVRYDGLGTLNAFPEDRRPLQDLGITRPHANWYQTNLDPFHGASIVGSDIDVDLTQEAEAMSGLDHVNAAEIVAGTRGAGQGPWPRRLVNFILQMMAAR